MNALTTLIDEALRTLQADGMSYRAAVELVSSKLAMEAGALIGDTAENRSDFERWQVSVCEMLNSGADNAARMRWNEADT